MNKGAPAATRVQARSAPQEVVVCSADGVGDDGHDAQSAPRMAGGQPSQAQVLARLHAFATRTAVGATRSAPSPVFVKFAHRPTVPMAVPALQREDDPDRGWAVFQAALGAGAPVDIRVFQAMMTFCKRHAASKAPDVLNEAVSRGVHVCESLFGNFLHACVATRPPMLSEALDAYWKCGPRCEGIIYGVVHVCRKSGDPDAALSLVSHVLYNDVQVSQRLLSLLAACCAEAADRASAAYTAEVLLNLIRSGRIPSYQNEKLFANLVKSLVADNRFGPALDAFALLDCVGLPASEHIYNVVASALSKADRADQAFAIFQGMCQRRIRILDGVFNSLAIAAGRALNVDIVRQLHRYAEDRPSLASNDKVLTSLVSAYGRCGEVASAERLLFHSKSRDPSAFASVVAAYGRLRSAADIQRLHRHAERGLLLLDVFVLSAFVAGYGHCCMRAAVQHLHRFAGDHGLLSDNVVVNAFVSAYGQCGDASAAERVFSDSNAADPFGFATVIAAYGRQSAHSDLQRLHQFANRHALLSHAAVVSAFIAGYARCSDLASVEAVHKFARDSRLTAHADVANAIVSAYALCDDVARAERSLTPETEPSAFASVVSAYGRLARLDDVKRLRQNADRKSLLTNGLVLNAFLVAYARCSDLEDVVALHQFARDRQMMVHDDVANAVVSAYGQCDDAARAERVLMETLGAQPASCAAVVAAYGRQQSLPDVRRLHRYAAEHGIMSNVFLVSAFVAAYGRCGDLPSVKGLHEFARERQLDGDPGVGNALASAYGQCGDPVTAEQIMQGMDVVEPPAFVSVVAAYGRLARLADVKRLHQCAREHALLSNAFVVNGLVAAYGRCRDLPSVRALHEFARDTGLLRQSDVLVAVMASYTRCGDVAAAESLKDHQADSSPAVSTPAGYGSCGPSC